MPTSKGSNPEITGDTRIDELLERLRACGIGKAVSASEWQEVVDHLQENLMTEDRIMKEYNCGRNTGIENAAGAAKANLLEMAADLFKDGKKDEEAKSLRFLAKTVEEHIKTLLPKPK